MNLGRIRTAVYEHMGLDGSDGQLQPANVNGFINRALQAYSAEGVWPWLRTSETITTASGTDSYTPAADWVRTNEMRDSSTGRVMDFKSMTEIDDSWPPMTFGSPLQFAEYGGKLVVRPTPDGAYSFIHRYDRMEPWLVNDVDVPFLPDPYIEVVIEYASQLGYRRLRETERYQESINAYNGWLVKMRARALKRSDLPNTPRVRPGGAI